MSVDEFANISLSELSNKVIGFLKARTDNRILDRLNTYCIAKYSGKYFKDGKEIFKQPKDLYLLGDEEPGINVTPPTKEEREHYKEIGIRLANPANKTTKRRPGESLKDAIERLKKES